MIVIETVFYISRSNFPFREFYYFRHVSHRIILVFLTFKVGITQRKGDSEEIQLFIFRTGYVIVMTINYRLRDF